MNQELKQRLIGAVVVTALAAIFIPMLFDDPVDNSGQFVSELAIPATPLNTGEESANKLPTSANQVLKAPDARSETVVDTEEEVELSSNKQLPSDEPLDTEPEVNDETGVEQLADEPDQAIDETENEQSSASLDNGGVGQASKPVKNQKAIQEAPSSKQKSVKKPALEADSIVTTPKKPAKKTETITPKQTEKEKTLAVPATNKTEKSVAKPTKTGSGTGRWFIQAGTFSKKENATALMETLRKQGLPVTLEATKGSGNTTLYRLKVGPALEKKRAAEMKAKVDSQNIHSIIIAE